MKQDSDHVRCLHDDAAHTSFARFARSVSLIASLLAVGCSGSGTDGGGSGGSDMGGSRAGDAAPAADGATPGDGPTGTVGADAAAVLNGGVGQVCAVNSDCPSGLTCHFDSTTWIAHKQCTSACNTDADCTSLYGNHTECIGAHICVSKCLDDSNCPAMTQCGTNSWCEHTGPGSGVPKCTGTPTPCALLTDIQCATTLGCTAGGFCAGTGQSCLGQDQFLCGTILGCYWDSLAQLCSGIGTSCSSYASDITCAGATGCYWSGSCTGQPSTTCESAGATLCQYTPGCVLTPQ
jgi:hypothetical protein